MMSGFGEGIGTAIEGNLLGRAGEPGAGEAHGHAEEAIACANCKTQYSGH